MPTPDQQAKIEALRKRKPSFTSRLYAQMHEKKTPSAWNPITAAIGLIDPTVPQDYETQRRLYFSTDPEGNQAVDPRLDFSGTRFEDHFRIKQLSYDNWLRANELGVPDNLRKTRGIALKSGEGLF